MTTEEVAPRRPPPLPRSSAPLDVGSPPTAGLRSRSTAEQNTQMALRCIALVASALSASAFQLPKVLQTQAQKLAAPALAAAVTLHSEAAHAKSVLGVNGALDFGPLAGDQPGGEGTGKVRALLPLPRTRTLVSPRVRARTRTRLSPGQQGELQRGAARRESFRTASLVCHAARPVSQACTHGLRRRAVCLRLAQRARQPGIRGQAARTLAWCRRRRRKAPGWLAPPPPSTRCSPRLLTTNVSFPLP